MKEKNKQAFIRVTAALAAAISLLEGGGKKAAASDKMFEQMLLDYKCRSRGSQEGHQMTDTKPDITVDGTRGSPNLAA